jgi:glycosyltransferase involved in cell wall biosynthesis
VPVPCAILSPVPVPYREPLFRALAGRGRIAPRVVYLAAAQPGWDMRADWFAGRRGYDSEVLGAWQRRRPGRTPLMVPRGLGAALRRAKPDVVVSSEFGPATWRALAWCRRRRRPLVVFSELTPWSEPELSGLQRRIHRALAPRIDGFLVASSQGRERLAGLGVEPDRVEVALQSADLEPFLAVAHEPRSDGPVRVVSVGRLVPDKNFGALIAAFASAGFEPAEAELVVAGAGPLQGELAAAAARSPAPVRLVGYVPPAELPGLYAGAHALALVSTYEPFGAALREAAAAGLPLLCTNRAGGAGDVAVEGENALLVEPTDRDAIAAALRRLVRDAALRARLAEGSRALTARHPLEADAEAWERAVLSAAARRR